MKASTLIGAVLLVAGFGILALRGVGYTKSRNSVDVGPLKISSEERGFVPPVAGIVLIVVGGVILAAGKRRT